MRFFAAGSTVLPARLVVALALVGSACACHPLAGQAGAVSATTAPTAQPVSPDPRVGAIFFGSDPVQNKVWTSYTDHNCTGGVLDSPAGDLILTAAHCMYPGIDETFVAPLTGTPKREDFWHIGAVYLDPRWVQHQDPMADFAIARVRRDAGGSVQFQAGAGLELAAAPKAGTDITLTAYDYGAGGGPIGCRTTTAAPVKGFPEVDCAKMLDGTSGAPWIEASTVTGLTGGLDDGGCEDRINYSPPFGDAIKQLLARAEAAGPPDNPPTANSGCAVT